MSKRLVWHDKEVLDVMALFADSKSIDEVRKIFDRVLTPREINDIGRRYQALMMIDEGKSYADIRLKTGMSPTTLNRLATKCGFGFRKSSGLPKPKKPRVPIKGKRTIKYKGVRVIG